MKKILITTILLFAIVLPVLPCGTANAEECNRIERIELENGYYIEVTMDPATISASGTVTKSKYYTARNEDGTALWKITLTGKFTYDGVTSSCVSSDCSVTIYESGWYAISKSATKSGNTAYGTATLGYKVLGVTVNKSTYDLTLTCDKDGNVS